MIYVHLCLACNAAVVHKLALAALVHLGQYFVAVPTRSAQILADFVHQKWFFKFCNEHGCGPLVIAERDATALLEARRAARVDPSDWRPAHGGDGAR